MLVDESSARDFISILQCIVEGPSMVFGTSLSELMLTQNFSNTKTLNSSYGDHLMQPNPLYRKAAPIPPVSVSHLHPAKNNLACPLHPHTIHSAPAPRQCQACPSNELNPWVVQCPEPSPTDPSPVALLPVVPSQQSISGATQQLNLRHNPTSHFVRKLHSSLLMRRIGFRTIMKRVFVLLWGVMIVRMKWM